MLLRKWLIVAALFPAAAFFLRPALSQGPDDYQALVRLHQEFLMFRQAGQGQIFEGGGNQPAGRIPDYSPATIEAQKRGLQEFRRRLAALNADSWPVPQKVDYLLVWAEMNQQDYHLRILRSGERDPAFYVDLVTRFAFIDLPVPAERLDAFRARLRIVPQLLEQARTNLTHPSGEFARIAIRTLERTGGVNNREPRRAKLPQGIVGWYQDLVEQAAAKQPELAPDAKQALAAVEKYRDWLRENRSHWTEPGRIGLENYSWYLRNVKLLPVAVTDINRIGQTEWDRARSFLLIEQNKNKMDHVPALQEARSKEELEAKVRDAEQNLRAFIAKYRLLTLPSNMPPQFESEARWIVRPDNSRNFWERHVYRDPTTIHIHSAVPGHHFDGLMQERVKNPIRNFRSYHDTVRGEGWAVYLEEMFLQAGLLDNRPRARELSYIAQLFRAVRVTAELKMQAGEMSPEDVIKFWMGEVPMMEENLARQDAQNGYRQPTELINTAVGKWQLEHLLADRSRQLGDKFDLGEFHDQFLGFGLIPFSMIRWEMTGLDDEARPLWEEARRSLQAAR